jgi:predicted phage terminase large subunit-like protein
VKEYDLQLRGLRIRIEALEPYFSNGQLLFLTTWNRDYPLLIEQLVHFPLAAHDDGPDALAGLSRSLRRGRTGIKSWCRGDGEFE